MQRTWHPLRSRRRRQATIASAGLAGVAAIALSLLWTGNATSSQAPVTVTLNYDSLPARAKPLIMGIGVHFGLNQTWGYEQAPTAKAIAMLGVDSFRDDLPWQVFKRNGLNQPGSLSPRLAGMIAATPARPLLIPAYGHPAFRKGATPIDDEGRALFASFAGEAAKALRANPPYYEIWNEWNMSAGQGPRLADAGQPGDPRAASNYAPLAKRTVDAIRAADPNAFILVGAVGEDPQWKWTDAIMALGATDRANGLSVHYYNHCKRQNERTAAEAVSRIELLRRMQVAKQGDRALPIYITETGWPTTTGGHCDIPRQQSGDNAAQFLLWAAATPWIGGVWIYQLRDQGRNAAELEDNFGLLDYDYKPKPGACMVADVTRIVHAARRWRVLRQGGGLTLIQLDGTQGRRLVAYAEQQGKVAHLSFGGRPVAARPLCQPAPSAPATTIDVGTRPVVIDAARLSGVGLSATLD